MHQNTVSFRANPGETLSRKHRILKVQLKAKHPRKHPDETFLRLTEYLEYLRDVDLLCRLEFVQHKKTNEYSFVVMVTWLCLLCWRCDGDSVYLPAQRLECCRNRVTMKTSACVLMCWARRWTLWACAAVMWSRLLMTAAAAAPCGFNNSRSHIVPTSKLALTAHSLICCTGLFSLTSARAAFKVCCIH